MDGAELIELSGHQGLAFVNSTAAPNRRFIELAGNGPDYLRWLVDTALVDAPDAAAIAAAFSEAELDEVAEEARRLREGLRPAVADWAAGSDLGDRPELRDRLNALLALDARYDHIADDGRLVRGRRRWDRARQLLVPPVAAIAALFAEADRGLVRRCEDPLCTLWFYDRTKAHRRRWCSMGVCGNRAKVRAHRERAAASDTP